MCFGILICVDSQAGLFCGFTDRFMWIQALVCVVDSEAELCGWIHILVCVDLQTFKSVVDSQAGLCGFKLLCGFTGWFV